MDEPKEEDEKKTADVRPRVGIFCHWHRHV
jgi:hypothetical protein